MSVRLAETNKAKEFSVEQAAFLSRLQNHPDLMRDFFGKMAHKQGPAPAEPKASTNATQNETKEAPKVEEKKSFDLEIVGIDAAKKLNIIKEFKNLFGLGLKEAKETIEKLPFQLKKGITKDQAEELKTKLEALGCIIVVK